MTFWKHGTLVGLLIAAVGSAGCAASSAKPATSRADAHSAPTAASSTERKVVIPDWLPVPAGAEIDPSYHFIDGANIEGGFGFKREEPVQDVVRWYRQQFAIGLFNIEEFPVKRPGGVDQVTMIATRENVAVGDSAAGGSDSADGAEANESWQATVLLAGDGERSEVQIRFVTRTMPVEP